MDIQAVFPSDKIHSLINNSMRILYIYFKNSDTHSPKILKGIKKMVRFIITNPRKNLRISKLPKIIKMLEINTIKWVNMPKL